MRRLLLTIVMFMLVGIVSGTDSPDAETVEADPVRVLSFNIRYANPGDGDNRWEMRRDAVAEQIRQTNPDILCLQEALRIQLDDLHERLPGYAEYGVGRDDGVEAGEYSAVFVKTDRFPVRDSGTFWLSDTPDVPGSTSFGNTLPRIVTWVALELSPGIPFAVFNTHLDHQSQESRLQSVVLLRNEMAKRNPGRLIVTGDFNAGEDNPAVELMTQRYPAGPIAMPGMEPGPSFPLPSEEPFQDTFRMLHPDADSTGTYNGWAGDRSGEKIDYIWVSTGWEVLDARILTEPVQGRVTSDHFPVSATLRMAEIDN